jgi:hypothetical protein
MNTDYTLLQVTAFNSNTLTATVADTGATSGTAGAYVPVATIDTEVTNNTVEKTVKSPSAGNIQIISLKLTLPSKSGTTFTLKMPQSISNGAGGNTSVVSENPPIVATFNSATGQFVSAASSVSIFGSGTGISNHNFFQVGGYTSLSNFITRFTF